MDKKIIRYMNYDCHVRMDRFQFDNSIAISLIAANTEHNKDNDVFSGEPISRLSICDPELLISENQSLVKTNEFNNPMEAINLLVKEGYISDNLKLRADMGFVKNGVAIVNVLVDVD